MSSMQSETGTSCESLEPARMPEIGAMPLPHVPQLENFPNQEAYESAWRVYLAQMEQLRPGATEADLDAELSGTLREFRKVRDQQNLDD